MNAVNLLPPDLRRGSGAPGRSGAAVYVVLGALALGVVLVAITAVLNGRVADREAALAQAETEAQAAEQQAAAVSRYKTLAATTSARVDSVRKVSASRVDWAGAFTQVSETVGTKVSFSTLDASATTGASGGSSNPLRSGVDAPALEIAGCAENHPAVARLMARFRAMNDVTRVSLASTAKTQGSTSGADGGCGSRLPAQFAIVIFLSKPGGASTSAATATTTGTSR